MWPQMMHMLWNPSFLVHKVGGPRERVHPYNAVDGSGTGFSFNNLSGYWFNWAVEAHAYYNDKQVFRYGLQEQAMTRDFMDTASQRYNK